MKFRAYSGDIIDLSSEHKPACPLPRDVCCVILTGLKHGVNPCSGLQLMNQKAVGFVK